MASEDKNITRLSDPEVSETDAPAKKSSKKKGFFVRTGERVTRWFREMKSELKKVVWPTPRQIFNNTLVALTVMAVAAVVIWGFDEIASMGVHLLISLTA
ncbi:MAG: preprotein translocase subunit SecE [Oscillospiraceae bacterium]